ncbi:MAG: polymer-forming cytoskeletal protein [Anaerolineae bacterium]|nr:polymer-forming cytoskeletal protein [Anaerolineae bacterium]
MVRKKGLWLGLLLVLLVLGPGSSVLADGPRIEADGGRIFVNEDVTLQPGEVFEGDLGVFDGSLTIPADSVVRGDVFVASGDARIAGRIDGDLAVIAGKLVLEEGARVEGDVFATGGDADIAGRIGGDLASMFGGAGLGSTAVIEGDLMVLSGRLDREAGARILGEELPEVRLPDLPLLPDRPRGQDLPRVTPQVPSWPAFPRQPTLRQEVGDFVGRAFGAGLMSLLFIGLGLLVVLIWPRTTQRVAECVRLMPLQSFGLGLLTFFIAAGLEALAGVLMIVVIMVAAALISTVILIPVGLLLILLSVLLLLPVPVALAGAMVLGWVALAEVIGQRVTGLLRASNVKTLGNVLVGLIITVLVAALLWILKPICCGWPFVILLSSVGLGAVFHTRFGRQSCQAMGALPPEAMDEEVGRPDQPPPASP